MKRNYERGVIHWVMIIIGILIVLTLVGYFAADKSGEKQSGALPRSSQPNCGLVIENPKENTRVSFPLKVSGYLKSCNTSPLSSEFGTVQLLDGTGVAIGSEVELPIVGNWVGQPSYFSVFVSSFAKPTTDTGFLLFVNHNKSGGMLRSFQIPVVFIN